jgi:hypothetical protein
MSSKRERKQELWVEIQNSSQKMPALPGMLMQLIACVSLNKGLIKHYKKACPQGEIVLADEDIARIRQGDLTIGREKLALYTILCAFGKFVVELKKACADTQAEASNSTTYINCQYRIGCDLAFRVLRVFGVSETVQVNLSSGDMSLPERGEAWYMKVHSTSSVA